MAGYGTHAGASPGVRGLSWKRQGADDTGECGSKKAEDEQGGQDMRNPWLRTQMGGRRKKKQQTYAVCAVYPAAQRYVTKVT